MRNWLRKLFGYDCLDARIESVQKYAMTRCNTVNGRIDETDKALNQLGSTVGAGIKALQDECTEADNAILKRLLAVETELGIMPPEDSSRQTFFQRSRAREEAVDRLLSVVGLLRDEVKAVKDWQAKSDEDDRLCRGGIVLPTIDPQRNGTLPLPQKKKSPAKPKKAR